MGNWYRRPKKLNLKYLLWESECEFIFDASQTSADEFLELQRSLSSIYTPRRLRRDAKTAASPKRILIVWADADHPAPSTRLRDGWRGVVVIPGDAQRRQGALMAFFMRAVAVPDQSFVLGFTVPGRDSAIPSRSDKGSGNHHPSRTRDRVA